MSASMPEPLWEIVEESFDEAVFLWQRWEGELASLTRGVPDIWTWTEDRLQGALDGVRAAGDAITDRLAGEDAIASEDPNRVAVSAHLLATSPARRARELLGNAVREAITAQRLMPMMRGIETAELDSSFAPVAAILSTQGPLHSAALCRLKAFRRATPAREVGDAFGSGIAQLQVHAIRAASRSPDPEHRRLLPAALRHESIEVRHVAIECGLRAGMPDAWSAAVALASELRPESGTMLAIVAMLGGAGEHQTVVAALRRPELQRAALQALAHIGTAAAVDICISGMKQEKLARLAAAAYCTITGADLERDHLAAEETPPEPVAFEADDLDANLVPAAEDLWPLPDPAAVARHWDSVKGNFGAHRMLLGRPANLASLVEAVETGPMVRRPDLLLELAARTQGRYDVEARAFTHVQRRMMSAGRSALSGPAR